MNAEIITELIGHLSDGDFESLVALREVFKTVEVIYNHDQRNEFRVYYFDLSQDNDGEPLIEAQVELLSKVYREAATKGFKTLLEIGPSNKTSPATACAFRENCVVFAIDVHRLTLSNQDPIYTDFPDLVSREAQLGLAFFFCLPAKKIPDNIKFDEVMIIAPYPTGISNYYFGEQTYAIDGFNCLEIGGRMVIVLDPDDATAMERMIRSQLAEKFLESSFSVEKNIYNAESLKGLGILAKESDHLYHHQLPVLLITRNS